MFPSLGDDVHPWQAQAQFQVQLNPPTAHLINGAVVSNTMSGGGHWPQQAPQANRTPPDLKMLSCAFGPTAFASPTLPSPTLMGLSLPLMSPNVAPSLGVAGGLLATGTMAGTLDQVVTFPTDPMSLNVININMSRVDLDHEAMDALMQWDDIPLAQPQPAEAEPEQRLDTPLAVAQQPAGAGAGTAAVADAMAGGQGMRNPGSAGGGRPSLSNGSGGSLRSDQTDSAEIGEGEVHAPGSSQLRAATAALTIDDGDMDGGAGGAGAAVIAVKAARPSGSPAREGNAEGQRMELTVEFLEQKGYFDMTLQDAAVQLGVGVTTLKKLCRINGLPRWPYRARCSLRKLREKMQEYFVGAPEEWQAADAVMEHEFKRLARINVGAIDEAIKQFRQAMFKLEFKARQQLTPAGRGAAGRKQAAPEEDVSSIMHEDSTIRQQAMLHLRRLLNAF